MGSPNYRRRAGKRAKAAQAQSRPRYSALSIAGFDKIPKQLRAWRAIFTHKFILYGGARGPGKSRWLRWSLVMLLIYWFKAKGLRNVRVGLFCETYPTLQDRQISKIQVEFPLWMGQLRETAAEGLGFYLNEDLGGGAILLRNLDKPDKYQSAEFAAVAVDELTKNLFKTFEILRGSLRWPGIDHTPFLAATNPGSVGHAWVKALWVDKDFTRYPELAPAKDLFVFIPALPKENPFLSKEYWEELNRLSPQLRRAWVMGDWTVFEGMAFMEWNPLVHVIDPFEIPSHWLRRSGTDWGFAKPWCTLWMALNPDNQRRYVYREIYQAGVTDRAQARAMREASIGEVLHVQFADPSMWSRKNVADVVTSTADEYLAEGVVLTKGDHDRMSRKRKVHRVLADLPDGLPGLQIFRQCVNLIRTLPELPLDETHPEDVDTEAEDHAYDALGAALSDFRELTPATGPTEGTKQWLKRQQAIRAVT